ncbi:hypothetical protein L1987_18838 [Smallanthus sonchifolius]|uniref:Uncharacterized protein n=1 Tax=Smallanthus sonchifolius TaxID=185202 RepID=A0ACB9J2C7_9ASTR|nr:hypothetical protein L1987_18838 [Smallanthus sonchifolius]
MAIINKLQQDLQVNPRSHPFEEHELAARNVAWRPTVLFLSFVLLEMLLAVSEVVSSKTLMMAEDTKLFSDCN